MEKRAFPHDESDKAKAESQGIDDRFTIGRALHLVASPNQAAAREQLHPGWPLMQPLVLTRDGTGSGGLHSFSLMAIKL